MFVTRAATAAGEFEESPGATTSNDAQGARCPADDVIMSRAEVSAGEKTIHLERCSSCRGVWFDAGEWTTLAEAQLLDRLDEFWTAEWRAEQRRRQTRDNYERRNREELGDELYAQIEALAAKLRGHARRSQALALLREASDD
ncbi:MAG TPA: zf-TFIIB domain-containing protein [Thermoanaerobaculia bacterium]